MDPDTQLGNGELTVDHWDSSFSCQGFTARHSSKSTHIWLIWMKITQGNVSSRPLFEVNHEPSILPSTCSLSSPLLTCARRNTRQRQSRTWCRSQAPRKAAGVISSHQCAVPYHTGLKCTVAVTAHRNISVVTNMKLLSIFTTPGAHRASDLNDHNFLKGTLLRGVSGRFCVHTLNP